MKNSDSIRKYRDVRDDGFIFLGYQTRNGNTTEHWASPERFQRWTYEMRARAITKAKERSLNPELLRKHAASERARRMNPDYTKKQTKFKVEWTKRRCATDPSFKMLKNYRKRVWDAMKGIVKSARSQELLGASADFVRGYIESQFTDGMTWDNYGYNGWHVDHIKPCSSFDLNDPVQQRECFHYTNLQPLWAADNFKKSDAFLFLVNP